MDYQAFIASLGADAPPDGLTPALAALWHERHGDWEQAHRLARSQDDATGARVHAYLHRVAGDARNAAYWYRRAGQSVSEATHGEEWDEILKALL